MGLLGTGADSDTIVFTTTELLGGAALTPGGACAGPEDDGCPGPATPPVAVGEEGSDPEATPAGGPGGEVPPLTAGAPESPAAAFPVDEQVGVAAPTAPDAGALAADPAGAEHDAPDELPVAPPSEGAVLLAGVLLLAGVVVIGELVVVVVVGEDGETVVGEDGAVPASGAVPAEQAVDPVAAPPVVETDALARAVVPAPASACAACGVADVHTVWARPAPDMAARNRTHTASASRQARHGCPAGDGRAKRTTH